MAKRSRAIVHSSAIRKALEKAYEKRQREMLIRYAPMELERMILTHTFHDRTGQASNSYCWLVCYKGNVIAHGFVGDARGAGVSYLHEWSPSIRQRVYGRREANAFIRSYTPRSQGWEVVWCAAAPYLGYHESGYTIHTKGGDIKLHFLVLSQEYDNVVRAFGNKAVVTLNVEVATY